MKNMSPQFRAGAATSGYARTRIISSGVDLALFRRCQLDINGATQHVVETIGATRAWRRP